MLKSHLKFRLLNRSLFFIGFIMQAITAQSSYYSTAQGAYYVDGINYWMSSGTTARVTYWGKRYERYNLDQGGYVDWFDGYISGNSGNVPSTVVINLQTYTVTSIGEHAYENSGVQSVVLPNTITSIGTQAFCDCELTDIVLPQSICDIGERAFSGCSNLASVIIPQKITTLNSSVFSGCSSLSSIMIPDNVTSMGTSVFSGCSGLTSVTISNSLSSINDNVFYGCNGLTSLDIPASVKTIGNTSFAYCSGLESISIPNSVVSIGYRAFFGCSGLTSLTIPYSVTSIGTSAFQGCRGLTSIVVDSNNPKYDSRFNCNAIIETSGNTLLMGCQNTIIPDNVTIIGSNAFYSCYGLNSINFPSSVKTIGDYSFAYCRGLTSVYIPNSITLIGSYAFSGCSNLSTVEIHATRIGNEFSGNSSIENLILGNEVETIADQAFQNCSGITSLCIPDRVTSIGSNAFRGCKGLVTVELSSSLESIGSYAFYGCDSLQMVYVKNVNPVSISSTTFPNRQNMTLFIPMGTKSAYETANYWKDFKEIIEVGGIVTADDFAACPGGIGTTMDIEMKNTEEIVGFQFDLQLPEGVTVATNSNGSYIASLTNRKADHTLSVNKIDDNLYRFVSVSMNNCSFSGTEGTLLNVKVKVDETVGLGDYDIKVLNAELTTANTDLFNSIDVTSLLTIQAPDPGDVNGDMKVSVTDVSSIIGHILNDTPATFIESAADMNGDGKVSVTDAVIVIGKILNEGNESNARKMVQTEREPQ